jgi:hypothetical protein
VAVVTWLGASVIETSPSGLAYDFVDSDPKNIKIVDIARALSQTCRFGGFAHPFCSVATHSLLVADIVAVTEPELEIAAFLHDAHEAYLGDRPRPMKPHIPEFARLTEIADVAIGEAFGVDPRDFHMPAVKEADRLALLHEGRRLMPKGPTGDIPPLPSGVSVSLEDGLDDTRFLERAAELGITEVR